MFNASLILSFASSHSLTPALTQTFSLFCYNVVFLPPLPYLHLPSGIFCRKHSDILISKDLPWLPSRHLFKLTQVAEWRISLFWLLLELFLCFVPTGIVCFYIEDSRTRAKLQDHCKIVIGRLVSLKHYYSPQNLYSHGMESWMKLGWLKLQSLLMLKKVYATPKYISICFNLKIIFSEILKWYWYSRIITLWVIWFQIYFGLTIHGSKRHSTRWSLKDSFSSKNHMQK